MTFPDALRAVAALMVILPHSAGFFGYWKDPSPVTQWTLTTCALGRFGVQIFFVISGFVIAYTLRRDWVDWRFFGKFVLRRSIRLDPPYWATILLMFAFFALMAKFGRNEVAWPSATVVVAHLFYLQNLLGYENINVVFWTLCIEVQFYLIFCVVLFLGQRLQRTRLLRTVTPARFVFGLFWISLLWPLGWIQTSGSWFLPHWHGFLAGAVTWYAVEQAISTWSASVACAALFGIAAAYHEGSTLFLALTATFILICSWRDGLYRWLDSRPIQWIAAVSYCLYLVHVPIQGVILAGFTRLSPKHEFVSYLVLLLSIPANLLAAYALHRTIEAPALRLSRRLKRDKADTPESMVASIDLNGVPPTLSVNQSSA